MSIATELSLFNSLFSASVQHSKVRIIKLKWLSETHKH